jgi:uncharacterized protein (UPF0276 family)
MSSRPPDRPSAGLGLKPQHFDAALAHPDARLWFEVHPENYMVAGGPRLAWLHAIGERHALSLHGVALSLASDAPPDDAHLARLRTLVDRLNPVRVSEHLAWSRFDGVAFPDLLPFPRTRQALRRIVDNVDRTQQAIGRRIAIENPSHYLRIDGHALEETDFLGEIAERSGCGLLVDVNNVYVSANNLGFDAEDYLDRLPADAIDQIHLAGHHADPALGAALLIDAHDSPIAEPVWTLYARLVARVGPRPTLIERDENVPAFAELLAEGTRAQSVLDARPLEVAT